MIEAIQNNNTMFRSGSQMITIQMVVAVENAEPVNPLARIVYPASAAAC